MRPFRVILRVDLPTISHPKLRLRLLLLPIDSVAAGRISHQHKGWLRHHTTQPPGLHTQQSTTYCPFVGGEVVVWFVNAPIWLNKAA